MNNIEKKIDSKELYKILTTLDSDEGIRIEDQNRIKKIFINRNLLGTYIVLVRINELKCKKEKISEFNKIEDVLEFIKENIDEFNVWIY